MTAEEIRVRVVEVAANRRGPPHRVRNDNGSEFAAELVRAWLEGSGSGALYVARRVRGRTGTRSRFTANSTKSVRMSP